MLIASFLYFPYHDNGPYDKINCKFSMIQELIFTLKNIFLSTSQHYALLVDILPFISCTGTQILRTGWVKVMMQNLLVSFKETATPRYLPSSWSFLNTRVCHYHHWAQIHIALCPNKSENKAFRICFYAKKCRKIKMTNFNGSKDLTEYGKPGNQS